VDVGSVLQQRLHHLGASVLGGGGERRAAVLQREEPREKQKNNEVGRERNEDKSPEARAAGRKPTGSPLGHMT